SVHQNVEDFDAAVPPHREKRQDPGIRVCAVHSGSEIRKREARRSQIMSGNQPKTRILLRIAIMSILAAGSLPVLHAQGKAAPKWSPARTPDGHPDMQGMWARRGAAMAEANAPKTPLSEFGTTGQPYPTVFNTGVLTSKEASELANRPAGIIEPANRGLPWRPEA